MDGTKNLMNRLLDGRGEVALNPEIVLAVLEYGREDIVDVLREFVLISLVLIPDNLIRCQILLGYSYRTVGRDETSNEDVVNGGTTIMG